MSIRSEEVNYLVYRYLQESGFQHTAFAFAYESMIADTKVYDEFLPPGTLVSYLQKALQYMELEAHVREDGTEVECNAPFSLIYPHKCSSHRKDQQSNQPGETEKESNEIESAKVQALEGHTKEVYSCRWCPTSDLLATGSGDSTIRLWEDSKEENGVNGIKAGSILSHSILPTEQNDITCIDWSSDGQQLVSASYNGEVKLWSESGSQLASLATYDRPVFNVSFSPDAKHVLVTGALPSFHILDISQSANCKEVLDIVSVNELERKEGGSNELAMNTIILDSLWKDDTECTFVDNLNRIINITLHPSQNHAIQILSGHEGEICSIAWNMDRSVLISAAEDGTIKLWSDQRSHFMKEYLSHQGEVNQVLASNRDASQFYSFDYYVIIMCRCSNDKTVKIFDISHGTAVCSWNHHDAPVTHLAQNCGDSSQLLASCGLDKLILFYDLRTRNIVRRYQAANHIYDIAFNRTGEKLSIASVDPQVYVLDLRMYMCLFSCKRNSTNRKGV